MSRAYLYCCPPHVFLYCFTAVLLALLLYQTGTHVYSKVIFILCAPVQCCHIYGLDLPMLWAISSMRGAAGGGQPASTKPRCTTVGIVIYGMIQYS